MKILLTNDDGIYSHGLWALYTELKKMGDVTIIVPDQERSGISHSITLHKPFRIHKVPFPPNPKVVAYIANGTPADCVRFGVLGMLNRKVDFVVSGINTGPNLGEDVVYSGTCAAAREACMLGVKAVAVSMKDGKNYKTAAVITGRIVKKIKSLNSEGIFFNVNVPDVELKKIKGIRVTALGKRIYSDDITKQEDPRGKIFYWLAGEPVSGTPVKGTDIEAVMDGYVSITPVKVNATSFEDIEGVKKVFE